MPVIWEQVVIDSVEPRQLGQWWATALGWQVTFDTEDEFEIRRHPHALPGLLFVRVSGRKRSKNRLHIDLRPDEQGDEVRRFKALGATRVDVGQGDVPWVVLADPEGNEFCILGSGEPEAHNDSA